MRLPVATLESVCLVHFFRGFLASDVQICSVGTRGGVNVVNPKPGRKLLGSVEMSNK